jgi:drug/metabolite transporter (DMT)-like permease
MKVKIMTGYSEKVKGTALMVAACVSFCAMASLVKLVTHVDAFKISLWRFIIGMGLLGTAAMFGVIQLRFHNWKLLFVRGLLGGTGIVMTYFVIVNIGISKGVVLASTYPIFAYIFGIILLKEKPSVISALIVATAFAGICLVIGGGSAGADIFESFGFYEIMAVCVGLISGLVIVTIRKLHETDSSYAIFFSQCAIGFWIAAVPSNAGTGRIGFGDGLVLVLIGVTAAIGQLMMTQSYKHLPVRDGSTLAMLEPLFCYLAGVILFSELFSAKSVIGTILIICSCAAMVLYGDRPARLVRKVVEETGPC